MKSVVSSLDVGNANNKSDIDSRWLPIAATLVIVDPNQPEPLMKLPLSTEQDSLQYHTSVLIDSVALLHFASRDFLTRNYLLGKCNHGPKISARIANEPRISSSTIFLPTSVRLVRESSLVSTLRFYHISNVWILSLVSQQ